MNISKFVYIQNYVKYSRSCSPPLQEDILHNIINYEEVFYEKSKYFMAIDNNNNIIGSIRTLLWDNGPKLPIEIVFNVKLETLFQANKELKLWHIGKFAIHKDINSIILLKDLIINAISPIIQEECLGAVAECDKRLLKTLNHLGIVEHKIGEEREYLGSLTIPVFFSYETLNKFYRTQLRKNVFSN